MHWTYGICFVIAYFIVTAILARRRSSRQMRQLPIEPSDGVASDMVNDSQLLQLLSEGKKINAIKRYREQTGVGLREAKDSVEQIERTVKQPAMPMPDGWQQDPNNTEIISLLRARKKINAIKLYREQTGVGLKEAKDAVEQIEASLNLA